MEQSSNPHPGSARISSPQYPAFQLHSLTHIALYPSALQQERVSRGRHSCAHLLPTDRRRKGPSCVHIAWNYLMLLQLTHVYTHLQPTSKRQRSRKQQRITPQALPGVVFCTQHQPARWRSGYVFG